MISLQRFKENDETEAKVIATAMPVLDALGVHHDEFFIGADTSHGLGAVLYDLDRDPMSGVITRDVYVKSFPAIHQLFTRPGTFEFYLAVFRSIWGDTVTITFDVPAPGVLTINAVVLDLDDFVLAAREIFNNLYEFNEIIDQEGDNIEVRDTIGIKTESEIDALMNELAPEGIFVVTTLTL